MKMSNLVFALSTVLLVLPFSTICESHALPKTTVCEYYNDTLCEKKGEENCYVTQQCEQQEPDKKVHCFVLWNNSSEGKPVVKLKGCFLQNTECLQSRCVETRNNDKGNLLFCCCEGNLCNKDFAYEPVPPSSEPTTLAPSVEAKYVSWINYLPYALIFLVAIIISVIIICYVYYKRKKIPYFNELPTSDPNPLPPSPNVGLRPIQLIEPKHRGKYASVWKAQHKSEVVAVKIFPLQEKQTWLTEQQIYKLNRMDHDNILQYLFSEKRCESPTSEFWLVTAYHENGSLCDFLKGNTVSWKELCIITESMARGLMHLHEELAPSKGEGYKPAVAHRDFKSKNVILKSDLTACIGDFGLALIFQPGKPCGDTHGQVGTRRYMAPEVLEGAINFSRDAFLRIDMYAFGLVLWEVASRCKAQEGNIGEYRLPFEEELGPHPTFDDVQEFVVQKKQRPTIRNDWRSHPGMSVLCDTMEECWDHDAEARLSASCVMERISSQIKLITSPLLISDQNL